MSETRVLGIYCITVNLCFPNVAGLNFQKVPSTGHAGWALRQWFQISGLWISGNCNPRTSGDPKFKTNALGELEYDNI